MKAQWFNITMRLRGVIIIICLPYFLFAQEDEPAKFTASGYLKALQLVSFQDVDEEWFLDNIIHNRLNFKYYPSDKLIFKLEMRNRLFYGETVKNFPPYPDILDVDNGWADMSWIPVSQQSYFLHVNIDRAYVEYISGNWEVRLGRQRINWGQTMVWNPNDVFNAYSFFDFDYEERPGSDAALIRYYTGVTSSAEVAISFSDSLKNSRIAAKYQFNKWNYDFQFLGGKIARDWMLGFGWAGQLGTAGFKGEFTWLHPRKQEFDLQSALIASISIDYTFKNQLNIIAESIFNSAGATDSPGTIDFFAQLETRSLTLSQFSFFLQGNYPITPLIRAGVASIYSPNDGSYFWGPSFDFSLGDNLGFLINGQFFGGGEDAQFGNAGSTIFTRLKWSF